MSALRDMAEAIATVDCRGAVLTKVFAASYARRFQSDAVGQEVTAEEVKALGDQVGAQSLSVGQLDARSPVHHDEDVGQVAIGEVGQSEPDLGRAGFPGLGVSADAPLIHGVHRFVGYRDLSVGVQGGEDAESSVGDSAPVAGGAE